MGYDRGALGRGLGTLNPLPPLPLTAMRPEPSPSLLGLCAEEENRTGVKIQGQTLALVNHIFSLTYRHVKKLLIRNQKHVHESLILKKNQINEACDLAFLPDTHLLLIDNELCMSPPSPPSVVSPTRRLFLGIYRCP